MVELLWSWVPPDAAARSKASGIDCSLDGRTKQGQTDDGNINVIMANYGRTGVFANINPREPTYGDYSDSMDLQAAIQLVKDAEASFMELPAAVRELAENNPVRMLEMLADEGATAALVAAGLPVNEKTVVSMTTETKEGQK
ncbi:MAG: internal scaffolding protein [Microvirus sp.]|nr:MAG: internal scaffolding protein [Microvirus sp.]